MLNELNELFKRDINRFIEHIEAMPEGRLWEAPPGVTNSAGILAQHIAGNLQHYVGKVLAGTGYQRDRDREFTNTALTKADLVEGLKQAKAVLDDVLPSLDTVELDDAFPELQHFGYTKREFLFHLYGHLSYHLGQLNYMSRFLDAV